jgi:hypothetical protein
MGRNVNYRASNFQWTGATPATPQATFDFEMDWIDDAGVPQSWSGVLTFPNDLALMSSEFQRRAAEEIAIAAVRIRQNVDGNAE